MSTRTVNPPGRRARHARSARVLALWAAASLGAGIVQAEGAKDAPAPAPLDLSLPRAATTAASGPFKPKADSRDRGRPYGSGYEARGLGGAKADAASAPAGAASHERAAPVWRATGPAPGAGATGGAQRGGGPGRGGRR